MSGFYYRFSLNHRWISPRVSPITGNPWYTQKPIYFGGGFYNQYLVLFTVAPRCTISPRSQVVGTVILSHDCSCGHLAVFPDCLLRSAVGDVVP